MKDDDNIWLLLHTGAALQIMNLWPGKKIHVADNMNHFCIGYREITLSEILHIWLLL